MESASRVGLTIFVPVALSAILSPATSAQQPVPEICAALKRGTEIPATLVASENIPAPDNVQVADLYARIQLDAKVCGQVAASKDKSRLKRMANKLGVNSAQTVSTLVRVGSLPPLQLISFNIKTGDRHSSIVNNWYFPWQPASQITSVTLENRSSDATTVGAVSLLADLSNLIPPQTTVLSPAAIEAMKVTTVVAEKITGKFGKDNNGSSFSQTLDPNNKDGGVRVYLLDVKGQPLTAVSMKLVFTSSLAQPKVISGTGDVTPKFTSFPPLLSRVTIDTSGRTLRDALGTDGSALAIARADSNTPIGEYVGYCKALKTRLTNNFGLNRFDVLIALAEWLSENSYANTPVLHASGCVSATDFALLKAMGLDSALALRTEPPRSVSLEMFCEAIRAAFGNGDVNYYSDAFKNSVLTVVGPAYANYSPTAFLMYARSLKGLAPACRLEGEGEDSYFAVSFGTDKGSYEMQGRGMNTGLDKYAPVRDGIGQVTIRQLTTVPSVTVAPAQ